MVPRRNTPQRAAYALMPAQAAQGAQEHSREEKEWCGVESAEEK